MRVRLGLIGLGAAARSIHLPACAQVPELEVVGGADPSAAARALFQRDAGGLPAFAEADALLGELRPDWVLVGAPPGEHAELCLLALRRGAHVFCEKPFVETVADADRVVAAAAASGRAVAVNHEFPRMPIHAELLARIGSADFGRALFLQAWQHVGPSTADSTGWRSAGRTLQEFGTHVIDLALRIFGGSPTAVTARMPRPEPASGSADGDPLDLVVLEFDGGRAASIVLDRVCRGAHRYLELRLDGERASLRSSFGGHASLSLHYSPRARRPGVRLDLAQGGRAWLEVGERRRRIATNPRDALARATALQLRAALEAVARGAEPPGSAREARAVVAIVQAAYESARAGRTIRLDA